LATTLSGRCPSTLTTRTESYFGAQMAQLCVLVNGSTCAQSVNNFATSLARQ
jgi:hypothetical protein